jgi:hypothetical protein
MPRPSSIHAAGLAIGVAASLSSQPAKARITRMDIVEQVPFADGASFGAAGPYVRIRAIAHGELDPAAPALAGIALLQQAPRTAQGMVEYETDVFILRPQDPARGSGVMLYDVLNRGNKYVTSWLDDAKEPPGGMLNDPRSMADAGNAFIFRRGYTVVWSGWQPEAPTGNNGMVIRVPVATGPGGQPITQTIRDEFLEGTRSPAGVRLITLPYPAADMQSAQLFTRANEADPRTPVPRQGWSWVDHQTIQLLPFGTTPVPRHIYDFVYEARDPTVDGIGFAAVRDVVAYLRPQTGVHHALGFGVSLSGRFLRHFLDLGMNRDEDGHRVFDGILPHIAGAGKVFANAPFAMPGRTATQHEDRFYPEVWQPVGYAGPSTLLRDPATDPKIIETNTSTEYWQKGASQVHSDAAGQDAALPEGVRMFMVAGTQHGGHAGSPTTAGACANPRNPNSSGPALRAALVNLEDWVVSGTAPPASLVPRRADQTGVPASTLRRPAVPGVTWAPADNPIGAPVDWVHPPAAPDHPVPTIVAAVDADGNEVAGLRLPHIAVPLGTWTGVNVYKDLPGELCDRDGIYLPFARTQAEREQTGDPRPSLEERYHGRDDYVAKVTAAADALVAARLLLPEDRDRSVAAAKVAPGF